MVHHDVPGKRISNITISTCKLPQDKLERQLQVNSFSLEYFKAYMDILTLGPGL